MNSKLILEIDKYIRDLLFDYDCVIVPQLGGFVTNYRPARIDRDSGIGHPPTKDIGFNKNLTQSDGLLERAIADDARISFAEAGESIKKVTETYWSKLNGGGKVNFQRIGVLYIDDHKKLRFEPEDGENYLKSAFGLSSFSLPPVLIAEKAQVEHPEPVQVRELPEYEDTTFKRSKSIYWVAAAALAPFVAMSIYIGLVTNLKSPTDITLAELVPFKKSVYEPASYHKRSTAPSNMASGKESTKEGFPENTTVFPFSFETNTVDSSGIWVNLDKSKIATDANKPLPPDPYHIIAGCFREKANADEYVYRLKKRGYAASILDYHKNLHRVEIQSFSDYNTALHTLRTMRGNGTFPNAWLLKKMKS